MGLASDALAPRGLMTVGAMLGAVATLHFGLTGQTSIFFLSRSVEGLGAAAVTPSLLAHFTDVSDRNHSLRARVTSCFELSLLAGLALGGLAAAQLWCALNTRAFAAVAAVYIACAGCMFFGAVGSRSHGSEQAVRGFYRTLREPSLQRLALVWLCVNTIVGLWLGLTLPFLLTQKTRGHQFLAGVFANQSERVGWLLLGYSLVFAAGVTCWSFALPRMTEERALRIALMAMLAVCLGLLALNHSQPLQPLTQRTIGILTAICIMLARRWSPTARKERRGGIYSVLLSIGAIVGSLLAAGLEQVIAIDGPIYGTLAMAFVAFFLGLTNNSRST